jgi:hypothetical protein
MAWEGGTKPSFLSQLSSKNEVFLMIQLLCRNRVVDFDRWWKIFASHADAHRASGLILVRIWRDTEDSNNIFFLFDVESLEKAKSFVSNPHAAEAGRQSGVIEGELHFLLVSDGY